MLQYGKVNYFKEITDFKSLRNKTFEDSPSKNRDVFKSEHLRWSFFVIYITTYY